jgi:hypothetical protein
MPLAFCLPFFQKAGQKCLPVLEPLESLDLQAANLAM